MKPVESIAPRLLSHSEAPPAGRMIEPPGQSAEVNGTIFPLASSRRVPNTLMHCRPVPLYGVPSALTVGRTGLPRASTAVNTRAVEGVGVVVFGTPKRCGFHPSK